MADVSKDFISVTSNLIYNVNWKMAAILFLLFLFVASDVINNYILTRINGAIELGTITTYGTIIQGAILVLLYIIFDLLIKNELL